MSIRIHELARKIGMENKDLVALLKERGHDVKSVSSTISNIYAEAIEQEFGGANSAPTAPGEATAPAAPEAVTSDAPSAPVVAPVPPVPPANAVSPAPLSPPLVNAPPAVPRPVSTPLTAAAETPASDKSIFVTKSPQGMVRSASDIAREKEDAAKAVVAARPPIVMVPVRPSAPPPRPTSYFTQSHSPVARPAPMTPPVSRPGQPAAPASVPPRPAPAPASAFRPPVVTPHAAPAPISPPAPRPSPVAPPPLPGAAPRAPMVPPRPMAPVSTSTSPTLPASASPNASTPAVPVEPVAPGEVRTIHLKPPIIVRDFALAVGLKPFKLISELMEMGIFASMNQSIDEQVAVKVAEKHGFLLEIKHRGEVQAQQQAAKEKPKPIAVDESKLLEPRPPVVCILGHVDHGKTSLLDAIRKANVAAGEAGGITQHIGAYQVEQGGKKITFLDTPGHAAFTKMRSRGASATDVAILVVAADDGFMPQTDEALKIALGVKEQQPDKFALIVAVNKMDVKGANLDQVKAQMQQRGIAPEDWGGDTVTVPVSAIKGTGIPELLEMIALQAEVLELKANPKAEASGVIIEAQLEVGRGPLATVIVQRGTLRTGDALICGPNWCKVRAMFDDQGRPVKEAPPATPVRVIGWSGTPDSGAQFKAVKNARLAEDMAEEEADRLKKVTATAAAAVPVDVSIEKLFANIAATQAKVLKLIVKTDVFGSTEAVRNILEGIKSTKVSLEIVGTEVGLITKNDVDIARAAGAVIIGFNTKLETGVTSIAKHHGVRIELYSIIYELADKVREMMADLLDPDLKEAKLGAAEVRATFPLAKGFVAGCLVTEGKITRNANARLRRKKDSVFVGKIETLKRFKDDANEVRAGLECGIKLDDFNGYEVGDVIEVFEIQKVRAQL